MAKTLAERTEELAGRCTAMVQDVLKLPEKSIWIDYDKEADVLYMSFRKPQRAKKTDEIQDDILIRKDGKKIVGVTILNASAYQ